MTGEKHVIQISRQNWEFLHLQCHKDRQSNLTSSPSRAGAICRPSGKKFSSWMLREERDVLDRTCFPSSFLSEAAKRRIIFAKQSPD
jgi:hypothetical protein